MSRKVTVSYEFNHETDSYEAKCPWCEEVVSSVALDSQIQTAEDLKGTGTPFLMMIPQSIVHDCWVEP